MSDWTSEYRQQITDCRNRDRYLSAWEADFLDSIESQLDQKKTLSPKQIEKIDAIWEKCTSKG